MANLIIDQGNTATKLYVFKDNSIIHTNKFRNFDTQIIHQINKILKDYLINGVIYSSVSEPDEKIIKTLEKIDYHIIFSPSTPVPIENLYQSPQTLGSDRLAGAIGANFLFPNTNLLIIDIGTAITYDFVSEKNQFLGGNISPGPHLRFKALNTFTARLPLVQTSYPQNFIGQNTREAILNGVILGITHEILGFIHEAEKNFNNLKPILTGGYADFFGKILKNSIFVEINLIPIGLHRVLEYNKTLL